MAAAEDFDRIRMECIDPLQYAYELIRPIVLFGESAAERSRQTGVDRTVIGEKARRFVTDGMSALADGRTQPATGEGPTYPDAIAGYILYLKLKHCSKPRISFILNRLQDMLVADIVQAIEISALMVYMRLHAHYAV